MRAGQLDRRISIMSHEQSIESDFGTNQTTPVVFATVWAEQLPLRGREVFEARQVTAHEIARYRIRWLSGLKATMTIVDGDREYDIFHIAEMGRKKSIELTGVSRAE